MEYNFFRRKFLMISLATLSVLTCLEIPTVISAFVLILWIWKRLADASQVRTLSRTNTTILSVGLLGFVLFQYRTLFAEEPASALLVGLTALKVMDYSNQRDHLIVVLLGFLLLTLKPLFGMDLYLFPFQMICMFGLWMSLSEKTAKNSRKYLIPIFLTAVPIGAFLFVLFPRIVLPWALSQSSHGIGRMGFSSDLNPGQVAELATSSDLAFRVQFLSGPVPPVQDMYWKGMVLEQSEGLAWKAKNLLPKRMIPKGNRTEVTDYQIILETGSGNSLFTLDPTTNLKMIDGSVQEMQNFVWKKTSASTKTQIYVAQSPQDYFDPEPPGELSLAHPHLPPESLEWVRKTKASFPRTEDRRKALRNLFSEADFVYTLSPGIYKAQDLDEFLFHRRRGFCEHFAGAYATLARALGIPARVVAGYQGAEFNQLGQFWKVTQRQSHAWAEIWTGDHWLRVDPTMWVQHNEFSRYSRHNFFEWVNETADFYEAMNFRWTTFLIDFDEQAQKSALREWLPRGFLVIVLLLSLYFILRLLITWLLTSSFQKRREAQLSLLLDEVYQIEALHQQQDLNGQAPVSFLSQVSKNYPDSTDFFNRLRQIYENVFYEKNLDPNLLKSISQLRKKWRSVKKRRQTSV